MALSISGYWQFTHRLQRHNVEPGQDKPHDIGESLSDIHNHLLAFRSATSIAVFSARYNIYISRLSYDASVRLSVMFVLWSQGAMDPGYLCLLG